MFITVYNIYVLFKVILYNKTATTTIEKTLSPIKKINYAGKVKIYKLTFLQCSSKSILSRRHVVPGVLIFKSVVHRPSSDKCWGWYCCPASHNTAICGSQRGEAPYSENKNRERTKKKLENILKSLNKRKCTTIWLWLWVGFAKWLIYRDRSTKTIENVCILFFCHVYHTFSVMFFFVLFVCLL